MSERHWRDNAIPGSGGGGGGGRGHHKFESAIDYEAVLAADDDDGVGGLDSDEDDYEGNDGLLSDGERSSARSIGEPQRSGDFAKKSRDGSTRDETSPLLAADEAIAGGSGGAAAAAPAAAAAAKTKAASAARSKNRNLNDNGLPRFGIAFKNIQYSVRQVKIK